MRNANEQAGKRMQQSQTVCQGGVAKHWEMWSEVGVLRFEIPRFCRRPFASSPLVMSVRD
jgi:hypothetical protein